MTSSAFANYTVRFCQLQPLILSGFEISATLSPAILDSPSEFPEPDAV